MSTEDDKKPVVWWNGCDKSVPAALRYLANHPRPYEGEAKFNAAHLFQLAQEIELMASKPLYSQNWHMCVLLPAKHEMPLYADEERADIVGRLCWNSAIDKFAELNKASITSVRLAELERAEATLKAIHDLRADEGDSITICCDNPEGPPNNAIICNAWWSDYEDMRFEGETLLAALKAALDAKAKKEFLMEIAKGEQP